MNPPAGRGNPMNRVGGGWIRVMREGGDKVAKFFDVTSVVAEADHLVLTVGGGYYRIPWQSCSPRLAVAQPHERSVIEVAPSGYGLHWPLVDEDLALRPLLAVAEHLIVEGLELA